jgi:hypothetical protein
MLEKKWECNGTVQQLFIDFKKVKREALYNILLEFCIPKKLVRLIKMCLNETDSKVRVGKHLYVTLLYRISWNKEMLYLEINAEKTKAYDHVSSSELRTEPEYKDR